MNMNIMDRSPWWVPWLFAAAFLVAWIWNSHIEAGSRNVLRQATVDSCERVNEDRRHLNERAAVLREFLLTAAEARQQTADALGDDDTHRVINQRAADRWRELASHVTDLEIRDCERLVPEVASLEIVDAP